MIWFLFTEALKLTLPQTQSEDGWLLSQVATGVFVTLLMKRQSHPRYCLVCTGEILGWLLNGHTCKKEGGVSLLFFELDLCFNPDHWLALTTPTCWFVRSNWLGTISVFPRPKFFFSSALHRHAVQTSHGDETIRIVIPYGKLLDHSFEWWARLDSNLGPTGCESLADNQPQVTITACVTFLIIEPDYISCLLL